MGVCSGHAYGVVFAPKGSPDCDWTVDAKEYRAVYMGIDDTMGCQGVVDNKRTDGNDKAVIPTTMSMWFR